jgi:phosphatidylglycerol:prolipoprotein diacylglycerol transferase
MYPTLIRIGTFEITTFGALVAAGATLGIWIFSREVKYSELPASAVDAAIYGVIGGLIGAKLVWAVEFRDRAPFLSLLFSRGGLSWFGGFGGGVLTGLWVLSRNRIPILAALSAAAPALAVGHAIGRFGCFMVGDDYGRPTDLPWGVAFPRGLPPTDVRVHPTQLYEAIPLLMIAWVLVRWRRKGMSDADVFGCYLVMAGALRFVIEFVRVNLRIAGPFTLAQLISAAVMTAGGVLLFRNHLQRRRMNHFRLVL